MKILIVDDETPIREWIQFSIERGNRSEFKVAGAVESGNEAYEEALKQRVDVVISDIKMPGMDGMTLMKKLMKDMPGISFIILTNHAEFDYAREAVTYGAKKYLLKSELRGEDILKALDEIYEEKKTAERDCFSNGYLDTYSCSHHREDEVFIREFWYKHHFAENLPFQVIGIKKEESDEKLVIDEFFERQKVNILRPILREENIFILVQGEKEAEIEDAVKSFGLFWMQREEGKKIVISGRMRKESTEIMEAVEEAESMLHYSFFMKEGCLSTEDVGKYASLDRKMIKKEYYQILNNIFSGKNPEMGRRVQLWFENFQKVPLEDLNWAKTTCIRFTEHLEELCQERLGSEEEMRNNLDWTLQNCRGRKIFCVYGEKSSLMRTRYV